METFTVENYSAFVLSTLLSILSINSKLVEKPLFKWLGQQTNEEHKLQLEKNKLFSEQNTISMVDEFAKFSKIQRKIIKIDGQLKNIESSKLTNNLLVQFGFSYGVKFIITLILLMFSIYYRYVPVFYLGNNINLVPFTRLICYPNETNYVSFYFWAMCCATVTRLVVK